MNNENEMEWTNPDWLAEVESWIMDGVAEQGLRLDGLIEQPHVRAWGTVLKVPTDKGDVYFKAISSLLQNEAAVTEALSGWFPDRLPKLLKADPERNWLLTADGGNRLRDAFNNGLEVEAWSTVLSSYAAFQIDLTGRVDTLLGLGSPDRRLARLPDLFDGVITDTAWLMIGQEDGLTSAEFERLKGGQAYIKDLCEELTSYGIPHSLHHGDLHDGNIFLQNGRPLFFDWGDSQITHPFFSLRTAFVSMENTFGYEENDPRFDRFARDYLQPWARFGSEAALWRAYQIAKRLWSIPSALGWKFVMSNFESLRREKGYAVPSLLQELLAANPEM